MTKLAATEWGALATAIHHLDPDPTDPPWKDNCWFVGWDADRSAYVLIHASTSPNGPTRTRVHVEIDRRERDLVEEPPGDDFSTAHVAVDLAGRVRVDGPDFTVDLHFIPRLSAFNYTAIDLIPALGDRPPLDHWQQSARVYGMVRIGNEEVAFDGLGFRDRTWGWRDEAAQFDEYHGGCVTFPDAALTLIKFGASGTRVGVGGFLEDSEGLRQVIDCEVDRNSAGLLAGIGITLNDASHRSYDVESTGSGLWMHFGPTRRRGPALASYEEFLRFAGPDGIGYGVWEHGQLRRLC